MSNKRIGGPCGEPGCGDVAGHPGSCPRSYGEPGRLPPVPSRQRAAERTRPSVLKATIADLQTQVERLTQELTAETEWEEAARVTMYAARAERDDANRQLAAVVEAATPQPGHSAADHINWHKRLTATLADIPAAGAKLERAEKLAEDRPTIVVLCGSTRFMDAFHEAGWQKTLDGEIVLSVGISATLPWNHGQKEQFLGEDVAAALDELHKRKIDLADYVFVLNVGGYVGDSTRSEIKYAEAQGKRVDYLEPHAALREEGK